MRERPIHSTWADFSTAQRGVGAHASDTVDGVPLPDTTGVCQIRDDAGQKKAL